MLWLTGIEAQERHNPATFGTAPLAPRPLAPSVQSPTTLFSKKPGQGLPMPNKKPGLYANIHAKKKRIAAGSGEKMRKVGSKGAPTADAFKQAAKTRMRKK